MGGTYPFRELIHSQVTAAVAITKAGVELVGPHQKLLVYCVGDGNTGILTYDGVTIPDVLSAVDLGTMGASLRIVEAVGAKTADLVLTPQGGQTVAGMLALRWTGLSTREHPIGIGDLVVDSGTSLLVDGDGLPTTFARAVLFGLHLSEGPIGDAPGTWGNGFTNGDRIGHATLPLATGGFSLHETFRVVDAIANYQLTKSNFIARNFEAGYVEVERAPATLSRRLHGEYTREEIFIRTGIVTPGAGD